MLEKCLLKKVKKKKQRVIFVSDDSSESESDDEPTQIIQKPRRKPQARKPKQPVYDDEYSDTDEYDNYGYTTPQTYTSMSQFYNFS